MIHWGWVVIALFVGGILGFFSCALLTIAKRGGDCKFKNQKGFTLIELVISMGIALIILGAIFSFFVSQNRLYASNAVTVRAIQDSRASLVTLTKEIRMAGYKTSGSTFNGIVTATEHKIQVVSDLNQDGSTSGTGENITYSWDQDTEALQKNGQPWLNRVQTFILQYTLIDGSITSTPADLTLIRKITLLVSIKSQFDPLTRGPRVFSLVSDITPRNLGL